MRIFQSILEPDIEQKRERCYIDYRVQAPEVDYWKRSVMVTRVDSVHRESDPERIGRSCPRL